MSKYAEKLKDPRWQKKRLEIFQRDGWECALCKSKESTLNVHHMIYEKGREPWDIPNEYLLTLCQECHECEFTDRPSMEADLLQTLRKYGFMSGDLYSLNDVLMMPTIKMKPWVFVNILHYLVAYPEEQSELLQKYRKWVGKSGFDKKKDETIQ